jgi:hypothetical protein
MLLRAALALVLIAGCGDSDDFEMLAVTFNTGTTSGLDHDGEPDDGYTSADAETSDLYYGDGLAWTDFVADTRAFFDQLQPDVVVFQEIFYSGDCTQIPTDSVTGFVCETWFEGDPTVAQEVLGEDYQIACHQGKPDKCAAVKRSFGSFRGCDSDFCLEGLDGSSVPDCGSGSRIGRGVIDLEDGGSLTLVNIHGTSGLSPEDQACRVAQFDQVFVDLGDGQPAANGSSNLIMGDLNTDPIRLAGTDDSADRFLELVGDGKDFHFVSDEELPTYQALFNIDHVVSDQLGGDCWAAGVSPGHPPVTEAVYFDHVPLVCRLRGPTPE